MRYLVFASLLHLNPLPSVERPYSAKRYQDSAHDADHEYPGVTRCIDDEAPRTLRESVSKRAHHQQIDGFKMQSPRVLHGRAIENR